jgi:hypothetical protein
MGTGDPRVDRLRSILVTRSDGYVRQFDAELAAIEPLDDADLAASLALLFDDNEPHDELMFSLIHFIEQLPSKAYIAALLASAPSLAKTAPYWATVLLIRVLNSEETRLDLVRQLRGAPPAARSAIKSVTEALIQEDPRFLAKATVVLVAASGT